MRAGERGNWYLPALLVGTAVATFLLGLATAMWLGTASLPAAAPGTALIQGRAETLEENRTSGSAGSPEGPAPPAAATASAVGSPQQAKTATVSPAQKPPVAAADTPPSPSASAAPPAAGSSAVAQAGNFTLQLGAFLDQAKAKSMADQLAARGYALVAADAADGYGRTWHYVRLGGFADERAAALAASGLLEQTGIGAAVVRVSTTNAER
jgi:DedD protein